MEIRFRCPECGKKLKAPEVLAGKLGRCSSCKRQVDVPDLAELHGIVASEKEQLVQRETKLSEGISYLMQEKVRLNSLSEEIKAEEQHLAECKSQFTSDRAYLEKAREKIGGFIQVLSKKKDDLQQQEISLFAKDDQVKQNLQDLARKELEISQRDEHLRQEEALNIDRQRKLDAREQSINDNEQEIQQWEKQIPRRIREGVDKEVASIRNQFEQQKTIIQQQSAKIERLLRENSALIATNENLRKGRTNFDLKQFLDGIPLKHLPFELLPPGKWNIDDVINYYMHASDNLPEELQNRTFQQERLFAIKRLDPNECYVGTEIWRGYVVFTFNNSSKVILECPFEGNATYVIEGDWKNMVRYSKQILRLKFPSNYIKVVHKGDWIDRVKATLH